MNLERSEPIFTDAPMLIPGGADSRARVAKSVGVTSVRSARAPGSPCWDVDASAEFALNCFARHMTRVLEA